MKKIEDLEVWVSPLTHRIYAGYTDMRTGRATQKVDITNKALSAVCQHLDKNGEYNRMVTSAGTLAWSKVKGDGENA